MVELARILAEQEKARRETILAFSKALALDSLATAGRFATMTESIRAEQEARAKHAASMMASVQASWQRSLSLFANAESLISEKESEPAELTPKKRIGFRFED